PSQPLPNPRGQYEVSVSNSTPSEMYSEVKFLTTLRSGKQIDNKVQMPIELPKNNHPSPTQPTSSQEAENGRHGVPKAPFPQTLKHTKKQSHDRDILEVLKKVRNNIPLLDAIEQIPSYPKFLNDLCTTKMRTNVPKRAFFTENVSSIIQQKVVVKFKD